MSEADWEVLVDGAADSSEISQGRSSAAIFTPPSGVHVYGFHSLADVQGAAGIVVGLANFYPVGNSKGGRLTCCFQKYMKQPDYSLFMFLVSGKSISAPGYLFGLSNSYPYKLILRRGVIGSGLPEDDDANLRESTAYFNDNDWVNLLLDVEVMEQGDVKLSVLKDSNDPISPGVPSWAAIAGMSDYVDDSLGILTGSPGLRGDFYMGIAMHCNGYSGRIAAADYLTAGRQTVP